jgi:hypothetical protein
MASSDDEMPTLPALSAPPDDPELHGVVNDFVDYTEYFPSDMIRSLTLIRNLDERYTDATQQVHEYALQLGKPAADAAELRKKMSKALQQATIYREAACAEANRLAESADRNGKRLGLIWRKLQALPLPPSRDPTPPPVSPQATRLKKGGLSEMEKTPKLKLHVSGHGQKSLKHRRVLVPGEVLPPPSASDGAYTQTEDSSADEVDDSGLIEIIERRGRKEKPVKVPKTPKALKSHKTPKPLKIRAPGQMGTNVHSQVAGISTSNALAMLTPPPNDAKPGSKYMPWFKLTEWEMANLRKSMKKNAVWTPSDTMIRRHLKEHKRGPEFYEKAKAEAEDNGEELLDEDPIHPDRSALGPGEVAPDLPSGQAQALENRGMRLNVAKKEKAQKRKEEAEKEAAEAAAALEAVETAKKPKKEKVAKRGQTTRSSTKKHPLQNATRDLDKLDLSFKDLFTTTTTTLQESITITVPGSGSGKKLPRSAAKKRKRETDNEVAPAAESSAPKEHAPKKLKINPPTLAPKPSGKQKEPASPAKTTTVTTTTTVPLAPAGASPGKSSSKKQSEAGPAAPPPDYKTNAPTPTAAQSRPRRVSGGVRATVEASAESSLNTASKEVKIADDIKPRETRPRSRGSTALTGKAQSLEPPPSKPVLRELRRASVIEHPASDSAAVAAAIAAPRATRANRRPAPGFVTDEADGKGKVSVGKRKAAPKRSGGVGVKKDEVEEENVDPNEERYCICGDVSWGTMVACENGEVCSFLFLFFPTGT